VYGCDVVKPLLTTEVQLDEMVGRGPKEEISCGIKELLHVLQSVWPMQPR